MNTTYEARTGRDAVIHIFDDRDRALAWWDDPENAHWIEAGARLVAITTCVTLRTIRRSKADMARSA